MFIKNEERGTGSDYIEFQICEADQNARLDQILSVGNIDCWKESSLYLREENLEEFIAIQRYFENGVQGNGREGAVDLYGINYFSVEKTAEIIRHLQQDHFVSPRLLAFLQKAIVIKNGFYILGL